MRKAAATGRSQVVAIGVAQEYQRVFTGNMPRPHSARGALGTAGDRPAALAGVEA